MKLCLHLRQPGFHRCVGFIQLVPEERLQQTIKILQTIKFYSGHNIVDRSSCTGYGLLRSSESVSSNLRSNSNRAFTVLTCRNLNWFAHIVFRCGLIQLVTSGIAFLVIFRKCIVPIATYMLPTSSTDYIPSKALYLENLFAMSTQIYPAKYSSGHTDPRLSWYS